MTLNPAYASWNAALQNRLSAGHGDGRARHIARLIRCQHHIDGCKFLRLSGSLHRDLIAEVLDLIFGHRRGNERGPDRSRRDTIDSNAAPFPAWTAAALERVVSQIGCSSVNSPSIGGDP